MKVHALLPFALGAGMSAGALLLLPQLNPAVAAKGAETSAPAAPLTYDPSRSLAPLVDELGPAVVNLRVTQGAQAQLGGWSAPGLPEALRQGAGSGFFVSADGYLVTNNHVIDGARSVTVNLEGGAALPGTVVGADPRTDLALVKVELPKGQTVPFVTLGDSDKARVGDWVVAIGAPFGLDHSVTAGIISAKSRDIGAGPYDDFIQTDASINPGNSGGPLFNLDGEVVGVNTAINPRGQGIGFSVPSNVVRGVIEALRADGRVARGWMGVGLTPLSPSLKERLAVEADQAAVVGTVYPGTPAAEAGLEPGDVIVALDGAAASTTDGLIRAIGARKPGEQLRLEVLRDGEKTELKVTLAERPDEEDLQSGAFLPGRGGGGERRPPTVEELPTLGLRLSAEDEGGPRVSGIARNSPLAGYLQPGDRLVEVNGAPLRSAKELARRLGGLEGGALLVVERQGARVLVELPPAAR
ncbi:MAG: trypsin-like peptidase domain-containing protein [Deltaproteobacteria bacterium]|nr:trypsin-like peptidase domain-containing protein [Deltaproteobacteria bacterium]